MLEVLIAVAVLGLLIVLLDQGLGFAIRVTAMQGRMSDAAADLPVVDAALRRLVANADPGVFPEPASLRGTNASLAMVTQTVAADGVRRPVDAILSASGGSARLRLAAHRHVERFGPPAPGEDVVLIGGVDRLVIDYADGRTGAWHPTWTAETLPALVRIRLVFAGGVQRWPPIIIAKKADAYHGDPMMKKLIEADLSRATRELIEGDADECMEALDHATKLLDDKV